MGKLAGWRPTGHYERVRESYMIEFVQYSRGNRDLPYRLSAGRKKERKCGTKGSSSPIPSPISAHEYGTTPRNNRSSPAHVTCSPMRSAGFPTAPGGQEEFEPPGTEDARPEAAPAREGQGGPAP